MRSETFVCGAQGVPLCANPEQLRALGVGGIKPASALLGLTRFGNEATFAARRPASSRPSAGRYTESATLNARGIKLRHARAGAFEFQRRRSGQDRRSHGVPLAEEFRIRRHESRARQTHRQALLDGVPDADRHDRGRHNVATAIQRLDQRPRDKNTEIQIAVVVPFPRITRLAKSAHELECDRRSALRFCRHRNRRMKPDNSISRQANAHDQAHVTKPTMAIFILSPK